MSEGARVQKIDAQARKAELAHYLDLFERSLDALFLIDPETYEVLDANDSCERILGLPIDRLLGLNITDLAVSEQKETMVKNLRVSRRRFYPRQFPCDWKNSEGQIVHMDIVCCVLKLSDGNECLQIIGKDVTQARVAEQKASAYLSALQEVNAKLEALAVTDELTQIPNVRFFKQELLSEHNRAVRFKTPYSVIFLDIDHFKKYNDQNGHPAGDALLKEVATLFNVTVRKTDMAARYGGEEFVVLCRGVDTEGSMVLAERLRKLVAEADYKYKEKQPLGCVSVSVGVASYPQDGKDPETVLNQADKALYHAKNAGRNKVSSTKDLK